MGECTDDLDHRVGRVSNCDIAAEWMRRGRLPLLVPIGAFCISFDGESVWIISRFGSSLLAGRSVR